MRGAKGADWNGMPGGKFSLGRLREGSGYCVGAVVETRMGMGILEDAGVGGNGLRDVWVLGERFFRGVGAVFDVSFCLFLSFVCWETGFLFRRLGLLTDGNLAVQGAKGGFPHLLTPVKTRK